MSKEGKKSVRYKLVSRVNHPDDTIIKIGDIEFGGEKTHIIAGPCAVENLSQMLEIASFVQKLGVKFLRGGAYKPRTSPYDFQGLEEEGLKILARVREKTGLMVVTEVMAPRKVKLVAQYTDVLQIGSRSMQNFPLLKEVGKCKKPILLKRGYNSSIEEWLLAAEYIMLAGNDKIILCERGIRTFESYTRNTLDLSAVPIIKKISHLPIIVDPSHGTGHRDLVKPMSRGAIACGADGLIIEVHSNPEMSYSDGKQTVTLEQFKGILNDIKNISYAVGRK